MKAAACRDKTFKAIYLDGRARSVVDSRAQFSVIIAALPNWYVDEPPVSIKCSRSIVHTRGHFKIRQLLCCLSSGGVVCLGEAKLFIEIELASSSAFFVWLELYTICEDDRNRRLWKANGGTTLMPATCIINHVAFVRCGQDLVVASLPSYIE
jgi:hypothetical protein